MSEDKILEERKKKIVSLLKEYQNYIFFIILAAIVWISVYIRMLPTKIQSFSGKPGLWDVAANSWTLGPDLDPFLFLRWTKEIISTGTLASVDYMRYVPLGFPTKQEVLLHPYLMAWTHKVLAFLGFSDSVTYSAIVYPVIFFGLTVIAFYFFVRKIFLEDLGYKRSSIIALISSLFLVIMPPILPRTIAGIPEKEVSGFFFLFLSLYLFVSAWKANKIQNRLILAILSGFSTGCMALVWGGWVYVLFTISISILIMFLLGVCKKEEVYLSSLWLFSSWALMSYGSTRYSLSNLLSSTGTLIPLAIIAMMIVNLIISSDKYKGYFEVGFLKKVPKPIVALVISVLIGVILGTVLSGPGFISDKVLDLTKPLISPVSDRFGVTVAENRQPYFAEWESSFRTGNTKIAVFFWLFFVASIFLYYFMLKIISKKERIIATLGYTYFLFAIIFSRYASSSTLNGESGTSIIFYVSGVIALLATFGYYYYKYYQQGNIEKFKGLHFGILVLFSFFFLSIISARGAVRTIMMLVPPSAIVVGFLIVYLYEQFNQNKGKSMGVFMLILFISSTLLAAYTAYGFYNNSKATASGYIAGSAYTQQWQKAMGWVRENTPTNSVFAHWWDYGYWLQSIGERATVLDGGNALGYWNHLMGRLVLTGEDDYEALVYLKTHKATHLLIDSSDIGKYPAFSSIGSGVEYDRYSWISTFLLDESKTQEKKNSSLTFYAGGTATDSDIIYNLNGTKIFLPGQKTGLGALIIERNQSGSIINQPQGIFIYNNMQYQLPLRYAFINGSLKDFGNGVNSGVFFIPVLTRSGAGVSIVNDGALAYLSNRTVKSHLARFYLYKEKNEYFKLVHTEDDFLVAAIKSNSNFNSDFVYDLVNGAGLRGPIRIWNISYPNNIEEKSLYLEKNYPDLRLNIAR